MTHYYGVHVLYKIQVYNSNLLMNYRKEDGNVKMEYGETNKKDQDIVVDNQVEYDIIMCIDIIYSNYFNY